MATSKATAQWNGTLDHGTGSMKPGHAGDVPFSFATRFEGRTGSNPEELIGAAIAGCFSMALSAAIEKAGTSPKSIRTSASVTIGRRGWGGSAESNGPRRIVSVELTTEVDAPGLEEALLRDLANVTKKHCLLGVALGRVPSISVEAKLVPN